MSGLYAVNNVWLYDDATATWIRATASTSLAPGEGMWIPIISPATLQP